MVTIEGTRTTITPRQRLEERVRADKTKAQSTLEYINSKMQERFPGRYHIAKRLGPRQDWEQYYSIVFDDPAEETFFKLKYPK